MTEGDYRLTKDVIDPATKTVYRAGTEFKYEPLMAFTRAGYILWSDGTTTMWNRSSDHNLWTFIGAIHASMEPVGERSESQQGKS